jgi:hypothetical protein
MEEGAKKLTAGQIAEIGSKSNLISPYESAEAAMRDYFKEIEKCVEIHKKMAIFKDNDFFIAVECKKEKILSAITPTVRRFFVGRLACPAPFYDHNVYKYHKALHVIEELWMMSDLATCRYLEKHKSSLTKYERKLLNYYHDYKSGRLWRLMKEMNNEQDDNPLLKKKRVM